MYKVYDTAFKFGVGVTILIFSTLNLISYSLAIREDTNRKANGIEFSNCCFGPSWGFPFDMTDFTPFSFNIFTIAGCGFILGFVFKFVWSKISSSSLN